MEHLTFTGGSYFAKSAIADAQRCINYYPEINAAGSNTTITLYQRPGLVALVQGPEKAPVRMLYETSNGRAYCIIGSKVFFIDTNWVLTELGSITPGRNNTCYATDNGIYMVIVDGSPNAWKVRISYKNILPGEDINDFTLVYDETSTFIGADRVDMLDSYMIFNMPGTEEFGCSLSGGIYDNVNICFDGLYFATKNTWKDPIQSILVTKREILIFGSVKSEIWYDAGTTNFPFAEVAGVYIEHGCAAKYSVANADCITYWLGKDKQGNGCVLSQVGYTTKKISSPAVDAEIRKIADSVGIDDAIGYIYQQCGHLFYVLTFPKGDQTWVYDEAMGSAETGWHQRAWADDNGILHRERANCFGFINDTYVVGDWENGALYRMADRVYTDTVNGVTKPITCIRGFPHVMSGRNKNDLLAQSNGLMVQHISFWLDVETGTDETQDVTGDFILRYSDDRGKTWTGKVSTNSGEKGEFKYVPQWEGLGAARDRVYEVQHSIPGPVALNGAWIYNRILEQNRAGGIG